MSNSDIIFFQTINGLAGKSAFWDSIFVFFAEYAIWIFGAVLVVYFFANRRIFWAALGSTVLSRAIFTEIMRYLYQRPRPFAALPDITRLIEKNAQEPSFPSGNAAILFAIAFSIYLFNKKIGAILIAAALIFSFARIYVGVHYPGDILGGIVVAGIAVYVVKRFFVPSARGGRAQNDN